MIFSKNKSANGLKPGANSVLNNPGLKAGVNYILCIAGFIPNSFIVFYIILCSPFISFSQENDFGVWSGIDAKKKLSRNWKMNLTEEFRTKENSNSIDQFFTEAGAAYKPSKYYKLWVGYRFSQKQKFDLSYSIRHRVMTDGHLFYDLSLFKFSYRLRFQNQFSDVYSDAKGNVPENTIRHRLQVQFENGKRFIPGVSAEYFYNAPAISDLSLSRKRFKVFIDYELNKKISFGSFYQFQNQWDNSLPVNDFVFGISLGLEL